MIFSSFPVFLHARETIAKEGWGGKSLMITVLASWIGMSPLLTGFGQAVNLSPLTSTVCMGFLTTLVMSYPVAWGFGGIRKEFIGFLGNDVGVCVEGPAIGLTFFSRGETVDFGKAGPVVIGFKGLFGCCWSGGVLFLKINIGAVGSSMRRWGGTNGGSGVFTDLRMGVAGSGLAV